MIRSPKVLVIDSDPAIQRLLGILLEGEGCVVVSARTAGMGLSAAAAETPDLFILDLDLAGNGAFSVLDSLRGTCRSPVMIVSARSSVDDRVRALDSGACDFVTKPFNGAELAARVRVHLRASRPVSVNLLVCETTGAGVPVRQFYLNGRKLDLGSREELVFRILAGCPGDWVSSNALMEAIWGGPSAARHHELRVYVARLRRKIEACGASDLIESRVNEGYRLSTGDRLGSALVAP